MIPLPSRTSQAFWLRIFYMLVIAILLYCAVSVLWLLLAVQLLVTLFSGEPSAQLARFNTSLGAFLSQAIAFLTFASEDKPFPFDDWPTP